MSPRLFIIAVTVLTLSAPERLIAGEPNEKAARLLEPLTKRPGSGPLFDRFVNAWLDTDTLENLGKFLAERAAADPATTHRILLALFHSRQGEPVKALEAFRAALTSDPGSAEIWYQKALVESRTLDFDAAIASLRKCLAGKPAAELSLKAPQLLGRLLARAGQPEEALKTWRGLVEARPGDEELREDILELQIAESLWPAAQETAANMVEMTRDPYRRVLRRMRLGDVLDRSGQRDKALETFAACLDDTGAGSWLEKEIIGQIEKLFRREDDIAGLQDYFAKLLSQHSHRPGWQRARARLLMEAGETEAAVASGRALMALSPGDRAVREEFIALLTGAGRAAEAVPQVEELLRQSPDDLELRLTLAGLKHAAHDAAGALAELRTYEQKSTSQEGTALRVAGLMERYGMTDEAIKTLRASLDRTGQPEARLMLASLLHKTGKKSEALAEWQHVAAPGALSVVQQTARAMQAHGEKEAAWRMMQAAAPKAENDPVFLTQLCALADTPERARAALPFARRLVELARLPSDLNNSLDVAQRVVRLSDNAAAFTAGLAESAMTAQSFCLLATLREAARDTTGATAALEKAQKLAPQLALTQLARLWSMRGDFAQAAAAAEMLFQSPGGRQGHVAEMLASLHQRAGHLEAALRWTQEWKKLVPGAAAPVLSEVRLLESTGRDAEALGVLRSAAGRFEANGDIRARLAALSMETGRTADALRLYSTLYDEAADLSAKMRWLQPWGQAALNAGRLEELIAQFEDRRRESRESAAPLLALAELHRIADNYDARRMALTEAARLKPDDPGIAMEIALLESREENHEAAIQTLRGILPKDPSGHAASLMADLLIRTGKEEEGLKILSEVTGASAAAVETAALALARRNDEKAALAFLQPHLLTWPDDWRLKFLAALLEWRTDRPNEAVARALALAGVTAPLPRAATPGTPPVSRLTYEDMVIQAMPPDVQRFFRLIVSGQSQTFTIRKRPGGSSSLPVYELPSDPEELRDSSAALVVEIAKSTEPDKQAGWTGELERLGYASARLVPELPPVRRLRVSDLSLDLLPLLREHPDSRPLLAFAAMNAGYRKWSEPGDAALSEKAWAAFHDDAPVAALFLALPGAGYSAKPSAWEQAVMETVEKLETVPPLLMYAAMRNAALLNDRDPFAEKREPSAWRGRLIPALERWRAAQDADGTARGFAEDLRGYVFGGLAQEYTATKNAAALASLLNAEWRWQTSRPQLPAPLSGDDPLAQPLGFPPWFLTGISETLRDFLQNDITSEAAALTLPLVEEPVLRVLLSAKIPGAAVNDVLQAMLTSQGAATAVPFIFAASWAEKRGEFAAAAAHTVKALYLPVSQQTRQRLDGALTYWASRKGKPGDALYSAGREAALRLRRDAVTDERRTELARLMDLLGLTEEADRLMRQGKSAAPAAGSTTLDRAERLLLDGKQKEALPLLLAELRGWARQLINTGNAAVNKATLAQWRTLTQVHGLLADVMQAMQPPAPTPQQIAEYAAACGLIDDLPRAREGYERALAAGVKKKVPQLLLRLVVHDDAPRALALMREIPEVWNASGVPWWLWSMFDSNEHVTLEEVLRFARFFEQVIAIMPENAGPEFPAAVLLEAAAHEGQAGDFYSVPDLTEGLRPSLNTPIPPPAAETERIEIMAKERIALYERLCRQLMGIPGCGIPSWKNLREIWIAQKKDPAELITDGLAMLVRELKVPPSKKPGNPADAEAAVQRAVDQLMEDVTKAGRTADFAREVVPAIRATRSPVVAARLLEDWPLWETPAEQFVRVARGELKKRGPRAWGSIIQAAVLRKTGADLAPDLLAQFNNPVAGDAELPVYQMGNWYRLMEEVQGRPAAETFFHDAANALLGPAAGRAARLKDHEAPQLKPLQQMLGSVAFEESWTGFVMCYVRDEILPCATKEVAAKIQEDFSAQTFKRPLRRHLEAGDTAAAKTFLDSLPVTEDLPGFFGGGDMALGLFEAMGQDHLPALGFGGNRDELTFGRQFLRAASEGWLTGVCNDLAPWQSRIAALPEPARTHVLEQMRCFRGSPRDDITAGGRAFYEWLHKDSLMREREEMEKGIEKFLHDTAAGTVGDEEDLAGRVNSLLQTMAGVQHPRGREIIARACQSAEALGTDEAGGALLEMLMEDLTDSRESPSPKGAAWLTGLVMEALRRGMPAADIYDSQMGTSGRGLLPWGEDGISGQLSRFMEFVAPVWQPGEARLLTFWLLNELPSVNESSNEEYAKGLRWLETEGRRSPHAELVRGMEMALRLHVARSDADASPARGITDEAALPVEQQHYLAVVRDAALPLSLRLAMATSLLDMSNGNLEPPFVHESARLLHAAFTSRWRVTPRQEANVFLALSQLPDAVRDETLVNSLLPLTTLPRLRQDTEDIGVIAGLAALTHLALRAGNHGVVDRLLEMNGKFPELTVAAILARHGEKQRLAALLKKNPEALRFFAGPLVQNTFDAALQAQLPAALEAIDDPGLRFETLAKLTLLPDADPLPPGTRSLAVRAAELAAAFSSVPWRNADVKDRVLYHFVIGVADLPAAMLPVLHEAVARVPVAALPHLDDDHQSRYRMIHEESLRSIIATGDIGPLRSTLAGLESRPGIDDRVLQGIRGPLLVSIYADLLKDWPNLTTEAHVKICEGWRQSLAGRAKCYRPEQRPHALYFGVLLHGLAGRMDELAAWHAALPEIERVYIRAVLDDETAGGLLSAYGAHFTKLQSSADQWAARLAAMFTALAANPLGGGPGVTPDEDFLSIKGATPEAFLKLEEPLTRARPDDVWLACAFIRVHAATGAWGTVLARTAAALAKEKPARDTAYAPLLELRTLALENTGRGAEALPDIKALPALPEGTASPAAVHLSRAAAARLLKRGGGLQPPP